MERVNIAHKNENELIMCHANKLIELGYQLKHSLLNYELKNSILKNGEMIATCRSLDVLLEDLNVENVGVEIEKEVSKEELYKL